MNSTLQFTTMKPQVDLFSFVFWRDIFFSTLQVTKDENKNNNKIVWILLFAKKSSRKKNQN